MLLASLALTAAGGRLSARFVRERATDRFFFQSEEIREAVRLRMLEYEQVLRGGVALFAASRSVDRAEWKSYASALQVAETYPGIQGFGFSLWLPAAGREALVRRVRAEGFPDFAIHPPESRPEYAPIIYLEPLDDRNQRAFGYDMWSEPAVRRPAMERARDSGLPTLSGKVTLVQENGEDVQSGVLLYLPVYRNGASLETTEQRRAALVGFVYAPFRMGNLMKGLLRPDQGNVRLRIFDGPDAEDSALLYASGGGDGGDAAFARTAPLSIAGREWTIAFSAGPSYVSAAEKTQTYLVAAGGVLIDLLLFVIIASLSRRQREAESIAATMTLRLRGELSARERSEQALAAQRAAAIAMAGEAEAARRRAEDSLRELEEVNRLFTERENRMVELKRQVNGLARELGRPEPHDLSEMAGDA